MKKILINKIFFLLFILSFVFVLTGCSVNKAKPQNMESSKKAVIIIAFNGFQDTEYQETKNALEMAGTKTTTTSSSLGVATGKFGAQVNIENLNNDININDYQILVIIGGPGAEDYLNNNSLSSLIVEANQKNKVLAAICLAPAILAKAGVLSGKQATVWSAANDQSLIDILSQHNAKYVNQGVVVDGRIITANGPDVTREFGQKIVEVLNK